jgi:hypothetical protein
MPLTPDTFMSHSSTSMQNNQLDPDKLIRALKEMNVTEEEKVKLRAQELGQEIGKIVAGIIILFISSTIIWGVLVFIFGLNIAWVKVFGAYFLFNFIKNTIVRSFKNN